MARLWLVLQLLFLAGAVRWRDSPAAGRPQKKGNQTTSASARAAARGHRKRGNAAAWGNKTNVKWTRWTNRTHYPAVSNPSTKDANSNGGAGKAAPKDSMCDALSSNNEASFSLKLPTAPVCSLAIVDAGVPNSASTFLYMALAKTVSHMMPEAKVFKVYWNEDHHVRMNTSQKSQWLHAAQQQLKALGPKGILVTKIREFYKPLVTACDKRLIFTTHRHPIDMANAGVKVFGAGWGKNLVDNVKLQASTQRCWIEAGLAGGGIGKHVVDVSFEKLQADEGMRDFIVEVQKQISQLVGKDKDWDESDALKWGHRMQDKWSGTKDKFAPPAMDANCGGAPPKPRCLEKVVQQNGDRIMKATSEYSKHYGYTYQSS